MNSPFITLTSYSPYLPQCWSPLLRESSYSIHALKSTPLIRLSLDLLPSCSFKYFSMCFLSRQLLSAFLKQYGLTIGCSSAIIIEWCTFLWLNVSGVFSSKLLSAIWLLLLARTGSCYSVSIGGSFIDLLLIILLLTLCVAFDCIYSPWEGKTFSDFILRKFWVLYILKSWPSFFDPSCFDSQKFTVFFFVKPLSNGFGSLVFRNFNTLGHLIASIRFTSPLLSNLSMLASMPRRTDVSSSSEADGLI